MQRQMLAHCPMRGREMGEANVMCHAVKKAKK